MLHLTQFSTNCSMVQHSQCHLSLSIHAMHPSIIYKRGGKVDGRVGKCVHTPNKSTNTHNHIPANAFCIWSHGRTEQTAGRKSNSNTLFWPESTYVYPQMSAHPESTEWSYEHITLEHKHFIPRAHVIFRSWSWRTAGIMGSGLAAAIFIFPFVGSQAMPSLE